MAGKLLVCKWESVSRSQQNAKMKARPGQLALLAVIGLLCLRTGVSGQVYAVKDLGTLTDLPGRSDSKPYGINFAGRIVAGNVTNGSYAALVYGGGWTNLGTLGGGESLPGGINNSNQVAGKSLTSGGVNHAFLWTPGATNGVAGNLQMRDSGTLGGSLSEGYAVNRSGQVTGYAQTSKSDDHAFRYSNGVMTDIGTLLGNNLPNSYGYGINDSGHVAGTAYSSGFSSSSAFFYNGTTATAISSLGSQGASALALNNNDHLTGYYTTSDSYDRAFRWSGGVMTDLGTLGGNYSYGLGINNSNVIVGGSFTNAADTVYHACIATNNTLYDLNNMLDGTGKGWTLIEARAINDPGQIVGVGKFGGANHAFLLNPAPMITRQPTNVTVACQGNATFSVTVAPPPLSYQWYKGTAPGGVPVASATNSVLALTNVTGTLAATYYAVVTGPYAATTSSVAILSVLDSTPPVLTGCPQNITNYTAVGTCSAVVTWSSPTAIDGCDGAVTVTSTPARGSVFPKGVTIVTCRAVDSSRNTNTCSFNVWVLDKQGPVFSGSPGNTTNYVVPAVSGATVRWTNPTAADACDGVVPVTCTPTNGGVFPKGTTTVVCRANDSSGNTNSCTFNVTVAEVPAPKITQVGLRGTNVVISFTSVTGATYAIEAGAAIPTGTWTNLNSGLPGTGSVISRTNTVPGGANRVFYRVRLTIP
jgi:probable HAF family extracellular repeat protein